MTTYDACRALQNARNEVLWKLYDGKGKHDPALTQEQISALIQQRNQLNEQYTKALLDTKDISNAWQERAEISVVRDDGDRFAPEYAEYLKQREEELTVVIETLMREGNVPCIFGRIMPTLEEWSEKTEKE